MKFSQCVIFFVVSLFLTHQVPSFAQSGNSLLFREDFKEIPAQTPITQEHLANSELILHLYGAAKQQLKKSNHPEIPNDPFYVWSGTCEANWAMALSWQDKSVDLSHGGKIRWKSRQSGFRQLRLVLELADGSWIVSEDHVGETRDWVISEFEVGKMKWRKLDMQSIIEGKTVGDPDLSKVLKIGISDLMVGGGTPASSRLDWIEVYGK
ncbi:hypothetical protein [Cyclobacterium sp.]|uniref:hypothetical protein n=1 Tax=Cyclobacterium sp. TaxID=1966343 RepID=UPI00198B897C|nr:hypothetical protein [Cyclobacterium sp.]MBD3627555.1 hypothetical protein [Cyclobacterium sp.]